MLMLGPKVFDGQLAGIYLQGGSSPLLLGPLHGSWVLLGHDSLTATYIAPTLAQVSYININDVDYGAFLFGSEAIMFYMSNAGVTSNVMGIDDIGMRQIKLNGAEVKQWQQ